MAWGIHVRGDEPFLRGIFPASRCFRACCCWRRRRNSPERCAVRPANPADAGLKLTALRGAKILARPRGQMIQIHAHITGRLGNLVQARATASVGGR